MLIKELSPSLKQITFTSKVKKLVEKDSKDFFNDLQTVLHATNLTEDYITELNTVLTSLHNDDILVVCFEEFNPNGTFKLKDVICDDEHIIDKTKNVLLREKVTTSYIVNLKNTHEATEIMVNDTTPFDTLVAMKYLHKKTSCQSRGIEFSLTLNDVAKLMKKKVCHYSGVKLTLDGVHSLTFDRIDSNKWYVVGNVVACSCLVNKLKDDMLDNGLNLDVMSNKEMKNMLLAFSELL